MSIVISVDNKKDRSEILQFIGSCYGETFNTRPSAPDNIIVARQAGEIIGTMGLNFGTQPLSEIYTFSQNAMPFVVPSSQVAIYGRWIVKKPGLRQLGAVLIYSASLYALQLEKRVCWCEHVYSVHTAAAKLGIKFHEVIGAKVNIEKVSVGDRTFYENSEGLKFYMTSIEQMRIALKKYALQMSTQYGLKMKLPNNEETLLAEKTLHDIKLVEIEIFIYFLRPFSFLD